jgi:hypothetical protein
MRTWNDPNQYQILIDALNFSNNALVRLTEEFIDDYRSTIDIAVIATNAEMFRNEDIKRVDTTNFFLNIPCAADSIHMERLTKTGNDVTWNIDG